MSGTGHGPIGMLTGTLGADDRTTRHASSSQTVRGTSHRQRIRPIDNLDNLLAKAYKEHTGEPQDWIRAD